MPRGLTIIDASDRDGRASAALARVLELQARGERVAWIVPTADMALALKRRLADAGLPLPGVELTTAEGWVTGRWTLWGDGRKAASGLQRLLYARKALLETPSTCPSIQSSGMLGCLRDVVRSGAGLPAFQAQPDASEGLSAAQRELMEAARGYFDLVRRDGLIETGEAAGLLAASMPDPGWAHLVVEGAWGLHDVYIELFGAAAAHAGVTYVGCLGGNGAFALERRAAELVEAAARARGCEVVRVGATACAEADAATCDDVAGACAGTSPDGVCDSPDGPAGPAAPRRAPELVQLAEALFAPERRPAVRPTGALRACLPAGRYAQAALLATQIGRLVDEDGIAPRDIVVAAADPQEMAASLAGPLSEHAPRGIAVATAASTPVLASHVGRFVVQWARLLQAAWVAPEEPAPSLCALASDLARNPLLGLPQSRALKLDRRWRSWRLTSASDYVNDLLGALASDGVGQGQDADGPAGQRGASVLEGPRDLAWVMALAQERLPRARTPEAALECGVWDALSKLIDEHMRVVGRDPRPDELADLLDMMAAEQGWCAVPVSDIAAQRQARALQASPNAVRVVRLADLDAMRARAVVLCDFTADAYPLRERVDAKSSLWDALGLPAGPGQVDLLRHRFRAALECACDVVVVERVLADEDAQATRPCALLEELVDCYRDDPSDLGALDRATGLPKSGAIASMGMGEEEFARLASPVTYAPALRPCAPAAFELDDEELAGLLGADAVWSPSALELLISCPMRWLHERRLPTRSLDAPFSDPIAQGTFCHLVLERFHVELGEQTGVARIMPGMCRADWAESFARAWDQAVSAQRTQERPFVAIDEVESHKLQGVRRRLLDSLDCEALLPAGFIPQGHELAFGDDEPVWLGGARIHGVIDRLDVNAENGSVLVVDYKGGLTGGHMPVPVKKGEDPLLVDMLPLHSQILMYLAAVRQTMGDKPLAGGLYVSYAKPMCAGFVDASLMGGLSDDKRAYLNRAACEARPAPDGTPGVEALLARVDGAVRDALAELAQGRVTARPRFGKASCDHCPLADHCPRRA